LTFFWRVCGALLFWLLACESWATPPVPVPPWQSSLSIEHPLVGQIWAPGENRFLSAEELVQRLKDADITLLGEHHDNADHHRLQSWALENILASGRHPVLAFEMILPEQQAALQRQRTEHPDDLDGLAIALNWEKSHWPAWPHYRPLFALALTSELEIRAANIPNDLVRSLAKGLPLSPEASQHYHLDQPLDPALDAAMAEEIRQSHCGQMPEQAVPGMVLIQRARDAAMALAISEAAEGGAVLIAGAGHSRTDRGAPRFLPSLAPGKRVFSLAFVEVDDELLEPAGYGEGLGSTLPPFDAVWFTPRANNDDVCANLANFLKNKKEKDK